MRLPVVCSIIAHIVLLLVALRLPAAGSARVRTITVDIQKPKERVTPPPAAPKPEEPKPPTRNKPEPLKAAQRPDKREELPPPPTTQPPPVQQQPQPPPSSLTMRPSAPVDLTLHGLGGIVVNNGPVSGGEGGPAGALASTPRKPYKPRGDAGDPLLGKLADIKEERFPLKRESDGWHYDGPSFSAKIGTDGVVSFDDHSIRDFKGLSGGFDLTDLAMRGKKQDPYRYEKEKFMEHTSKLRADLQTKARKAQLEESLAYLPTHLQDVWSDPNRPARDRRRVLYALWREAAGSDDEVGAAGRKARATIEAFIRERLPEGSEDAFTDDEMRRYNARAGAIRFEPYKQQ
ncbi:MAG: hypothetical protein JWN44_5164 [Myxococcales bacterium]|nr:hypothetical protein [Myxococcales bacterium]